MSQSREQAIRKVSGLNPLISKVRKLIDRKTQPSQEPAPLLSLFISSTHKWPCLNKHIQFKEPLLVHITFIQEPIQPTAVVSPLPAATQQAFSPQGQGHQQNCPGHTHWNVNCGLFIFWGA